jgi:heme/copper-type cytochrome/quinol oxidase subunit 3
MRILRLAYVAEFFLVLMAVFAVWGQVGGQNHLDLMPWYAKLVLGVSLSFSCVKATSAAVAREKWWNARTLRWIALSLVMVVLCALITYYYHLYEPEDEEGEESVTALWGGKAFVLTDLRESAAQLQLLAPAGEPDHQPAIVIRGALPGIDFIARPQLKV